MASGAAGSASTSKSGSLSGRPLGAARLGRGRLGQRGGELHEAARRDGLDLGGRVDQGQPGLERVGVVGLVLGGLIELGPQRIGSAAAASAAEVESVRSMVGVGRGDGIDPFERGPAVGQVDPDPVSFDLELGHSIGDALHLGQERLGRHDRAIDARRVGAEVQADQLELVRRARRPARRWRPRAWAPGPNGAPTRGRPARRRPRGGRTPRGRPLRAGRAAPDARDRPRSSRRPWPSGPRTRPSRAWARSSRCSAIGSMASRPAPIT